MEIILPLILTAVFLAAISALVSSLETAVAAVGDAEIASLRHLSGLLHNRTRIENALLMTNTLATLPLVVICVQIVLSFPTVERVSTLGLAGIFTGIIFLCEVLPKMAALAHPVGVLRIGMPVITVSTAIFAPPCHMLERWCDKLASWITRRNPMPPNLTDEEIQTLLTLAHEEGSLMRGEYSILSEIRKLAHETARHCMTPRVDIFTIPDDLDNAAVAELVRTRRFRRVPVVGETPDDVLGILDVRRFLLDPQTPYLEQLIPPSFVPDTINVLELLRAFLQHKQQIAILVDEFGGVSGVITLSDIIEEITHGIVPVREAQELYIERLDEDRILASGSARLDDIAEVSGWNVSHDEVETIAGLLLDRVGHTPRQGEKITLNEWSVTVRRATGRRIREVLIERNGGSL